MSERQLRPTSRTSKLLQNLRWQRTVAFASRTVAPLRSVNRLVWADLANKVAAVVRQVTLQLPKPLISFAAPDLFDHMTKVMQSCHLRIVELGSVQIRLFN